MFGKYADRSLSGKANKFPIADEANRAELPSQEAQEQRLLLHPCMDDPERHLEFVEKGEVYPRKDKSGLLSPMGMASIDVYGLGRKRLIDARSSVQVKLEALIALAEYQIRLKDRYPNDPEVEESLKKIAA